MGWPPQGAFRPQRSTRWPTHERGHRGIRQDLPRLRPNDRMATEMGQGLGVGAVLLPGLPSPWPAGLGSATRGAHPRAARGPGPRRDDLPERGGPGLCPGGLAGLDGGGTLRGPPPGGRGHDRDHATGASDRPGPRERPDPVAPIEVIPADPRDVPDTPGEGFQGMASRRGLHRNRPAGGGLGPGTRVRSTDCTGEPVCDATSNAAHRDPDRSRDSDRGPRRPGHDPFHPAADRRGPIVRRGSAPTIPLVAGPGYPRRAFAGHEPRFRGLAIHPHWDGGSYRSGPRCRTAGPSHRRGVQPPPVDGRRLRPGVGSVTRRHRIQDG